MWRVKLLASGSRGNSTLVQSDHGAFLVDAGLSGRELVRRLEAEGVLVEELEGVLITHEHGDHIDALPVLAKRHKLKLYANRGTATVLRKKFLADYPEWRVFETGQVFSLAGVAIRTHKISHDAVEPIAIVMDYGNARFGIITDLGKATHLDVHAFQGLNGLILEANYDLTMLHNDPLRPWDVKQRILSRFGHLSNEAARDFLLGVAWEGLQRVILGHLSEDCNSPDVALRCVQSGLREHGMDKIEVCVASQDRGAEAWVM
ncbi:MAG: MBL fold metallo-hydrolase [Methylacidiphilales bacterium]|nr:MBL fold metallo-hydrolase [Candidatus Methylacidiphilales bacterium]MDW8349298.1 MBL fold metallo-hydrolase [Verrucomicrobiae bacterium]